VWPTDIRPSLKCAHTVRVNPCQPTFPCRAVLSSVWHSVIDLLYYFKPCHVLEGSVIVVLEINGQDFIWYMCMSEAHAHTQHTHTHAHTHTHKVAQHTETNT